MFLFLLGLVELSDVGCAALVMLIAGVLVLSWRLFWDWRTALAQRAAIADVWGAREGRGGPRC